MSPELPVKVVVLDIEGTVCPISFVKDTLFPYALKVLPQTLAAKWDDEEFKQYRDAFPSEYATSPQALESHVQELVAKDSKISYLKSLQGYLWQTGYESGDIRSPMFADVPPAMKLWHQNKIQIIIYSSGSVAAQKLLFQYTNNSPDADLRVLISDYFDTINAGPKMETNSYVKIHAAHSDTEIKQFLFLSDNVKEVDAALAAGMQSFVVERPGNAPLAPEDRERHRIIATFDDLNLV